MPEEYYTLLGNKGIKEDDERVRECSISVQMGV